MKRLAALALALALAAACVANVPPAPLALPVSPLPFPAQAVSPLPSPGRVGALGVPPTMRAYLPISGASTFLPCAHNRQAAAMLAILANAGWQNRKRVRCHPLLSNAAQAKTDDMAAGVYASHNSPENVSPNDNVRAAGFPLPLWYAAGANNVESYAAGWGYGTPEIVLAAWAASPLHWRHLSAAGEPFFIGQECMAVGYTQTFGQGFQHYWIVLSAPCPDGH